MSLGVKINRENPFTYNPEKIAKQSPLTKITPPTNNVNQKTFSKTRIPDARTCDEAQFLTPNRSPLLHVCKQSFIGRYAGRSW